ncbi:MAG: flavodoxin family protein [bacterium]|nr:flavodoxin family protein [bacterium]
MSLKMLGISSGPRIKGNTDLLLREVMSGAASAGANTEYISLNKLKIAPCMECNACYKTGVCRVEDDYQTVFTKMLDSDRLIFATPVFFMAVCAQGKLLIDRCQCLWSRKYVLKKSLFSTGSRDRRGMVIAVGGSKSKKMFDSIRLTMKYYFDVLEATYAANLFVNKIDDRGDILKHPIAMKEAFRLGHEFAGEEVPLPQEPVDVDISGNSYNSTEISRRF